jgi:DNA-binding CsgD family transcriptional regulator
MKSQMDLQKKAIRDLEKQIMLLKERSHYKELEMTRISTAIGEKIARLNELVVLISSLEIDPAEKNNMIEGCLSLIGNCNYRRSSQSDFTETDSVWLSNLQKKFPKLNQRDIRVLHLIRLDHNTSEIAKMFDMSTRGVESVRYRLHQKLGLSKSQSIKMYLLGFAIS